MGLKQEVVAEFGNLKQKCLSGELTLDVFSKKIGKLMLKYNDKRLKNKIKQLKKENERLKVEVDCLQTALDNVSFENKNLSCEESINKESLRLYLYENLYVQRVFNEDDELVLTVFVIYDQLVNTQCLDDIFEAVITNSLGERCIINADYEVSVLYTIKDEFEHKDKYIGQLMKTLLQSNLVTDDIILHETYIDGIGQSLIYGVNNFLAYHDVVREDEDEDVLEDLNCTECPTQCPFSDKTCIDDDLDTISDEDYTFYLDDGLEEDDGLNIFDDISNDNFKKSVKNFEDKLKNDIHKEEVLDKIQELCGIISKRADKLLEDTDKLQEKLKETSTTIKEKVLTEDDKIDVEKVSKAAEKITTSVKDFIESLK